MTLEDTLKRKLELTYILNNERLNILEELTEAGKPKFSNELKREQELLKRLPKEVKESDELDIDIEIFRLSISMLGQEIDSIPTVQTTKVINEKVNTSGSSV